MLSEQADLKTKSRKAFLKPFTRFTRWHSSKNRQWPPYPYCTAKSVPDFPREIRSEGKHALFIYGLAESGYVRLII